MKGPLIAGGWVLTAAAAFFAGRSGGAAGPDDGAAAADRAEAARLERRVEELTRKLADERTRRPRGDAPREREGDDSGVPQSISPAAPVRDAAPPGPHGAAVFSAEGAASGAELSKRFMTFVDAQLARGADGHAPIIEALNALWRDKETVKGLFADETSMSRELYPWIKFLVTREAEVLDLTEFVFRSMAEKPDVFAETPDSGALEVFTEGLAVVIPGAIPEERMARFRRYAAQVLETPESAQPKAVRGNRSEIERLLARFWAAPLTPEEALLKLKSGAVPARDLLRILRLVPKEALAELDVTGLVAPLVREGNSDVLRILGTPPLDRLDAARLDQAMLDAMDAGRTNAPAVANFLQRTGRTRWTEVRPFFDRALALSDAAVSVAAQTLAASLPQNLRPDREYVADLLQRRTVPDGAARQLRAVYRIE